MVLDCVVNAVTFDTGEALFKCKSSEGVHLIFWVLLLVLLCHHISYLEQAEKDGSYLVRVLLVKCQVLIALLLRQYALVIEVARVGQ